MRKTWKDFKEWADRYRYVLAIAGIAFGSAVVALGPVMTYYEAREVRLRNTYDGQIEGLRVSLDTERITTRDELHDIQIGLTEATKALGAVAAQLGVITAQSGENADIAVEAAEAADKASKAAKKAVNKAVKEISKNKIRIREVVPARELELVPNVK